MSLSKWAYYVWACEVESQQDIEWADTELKCGYCREDIARRQEGQASSCVKCKLYKEQLCGIGKDDAYHQTIDTKLPWSTRRRASRKMLRAILADRPRPFKKVLDK